MVLTLWKQLIPPGRKRLVLLVGLVGVAPVSVDALPPRAPIGNSPEPARFFRDRIEPILRDHCFRCHSDRADQVEADLRLDSREALLRGGDQGPAVEPGEPDRSLLMTAVRYELDDLKMPPDRRLDDRQIADLEQWIRMGTPYGDGP